MPGSKEQVWHGTEFGCFRKGKHESALSSNNYNPQGISKRIKAQVCDVLFTVVKY